MTAARTVRAAGLLATSLALAPNAWGQTAEELLAAHAEALGGRIALEAVETMRRAGDTFFESSFTGRLDGRIEMEIVAGEKAYRSSDMGSFSTSAGWDGSTAWELGPMGYRELSGDERELIRQMALPFYTAGLGLAPDAEIARAEDQELNGVSHHVLRLGAPGGAELTVFLHPETHLPARITHTADLPNLGPSELIQEPSDYAEHAGVVLPSRVRVAIPGVFTSETTFDETSINEPVDAERFEPPR
jgi:hypothetical protein